jgi:cell division ATPase FtsA
MITDEPTLHEKELNQADIINEVLKAKRENSMEENYVIKVITKQSLEIDEPNISSLALQPFHPEIDNP